MSILLDPGFELHLPDHADHADLEAEVTQSTAQVVLNGDRLRLKQLAMGQRHPQFLTAYGLHPEGTIEHAPKPLMAILYFSGRLSAGPGEK